MARRIADFGESLDIDHIEAGAAGPIRSFDPGHNQHRLGSAGEQPRSARALQGLEQLAEFEWVAVEADLDCLTAGD